VVVIALVAFVLSRFVCTWLMRYVSPGNLLAIQEALVDLHPVHRPTPGRQPLELTTETAAQFANLYLDTDLGRLDCLSAIEGIGDYAEAKQASEVIEVEGIRLRVLTLEALIRSKEALHRPPDREALRQLKAIRSPKRGTPWSLRTGQPNNGSSFFFPINMLAPPDAFLVAAEGEALHLETGTQRPRDRTIPPVAPAHQPVAGRRAGWTGECPADTLGTWRSKRRTRETQVRSPGLPASALRRTISPFESPKGRSARRGTGARYDM